MWGFDLRKDLEELETAYGILVLSCFSHWLQTIYCIPLCMDQVILLKVLWLGHMSKSPTLKLAQSHVRISSEQVRTQPFQVLPSLQWTCIGFVPSHSATLSEKKA